MPAEMSATPALDLATPLGFALAATPRVRAVRATAAAVETFGWDTVSAIRIPFVNQAIAAARSSPPSFACTHPDGVYECTGTFGAWSITPGGDGSNVRMALPVMDLRGWYQMDEGPAPFTCGAGTIIIEIKLQYLPQEPPTGARTGRFKKLLVRTESPAPTDPVVSLVTVLWSDGPPKGYASYVVEAAIVAWGNAHLADFTHVFNTVNLDRIIDKGQWAYCNPTYTTYAYADGPTPQASVLGILSMTSNRSPGANTQQLDARAIPPDCEAGFLLSINRFLTELVLPTLLTQWPAALAAQFAISDAAIELIDGQTFELPVVEHNGTSYTPTLQQFSFKIIATEIEVMSYSTVEVSPGISAWCRSTRFYTVGLGTKTGAQTLVYNEAASPIETHGTTQAEGVVITEIIVAIIGGLVIIVLGALTAGAALLVGCLIVGILFGVAGAIPTIIEMANNDDAPAIDLLAFNVSDPMVWTGGSRFRLRTAGINGPLQLGGSLGFGVDG